MGNKVSLEDELINLKLSSKQMVMASKKCEKNQKKQLKDVQSAIKKGNREGAQIYAQNAIREKTQGMNYLRLSSRIDAVASRLETAIRTKQVSFNCKFEIDFISFLVLTLFVSVTDYRVDARSV